MVPAPILRLLNRLRWRDRWQGLARGLGRGVALVVVAVLLACLADWVVDRFVDVPVALQAVLSLLPLIALGAAGFLLIAPLLKRSRDDDLALWIERHVPLGQRLIAAVQLNRKTADVRGMSPALIAAVTRRAESDAAGVDLARVCDSSRLKQGLLLALPAVVVVGLVLLLAPETMAALLQRRLLRGVEVPRSVALASASAEIWPANEEGTLRIRVTRGDPGETARGVALVTYASVEESEGDRKGIRARRKTSTISVPLTYEGKDDKGLIYSGKVPPSDVPFTFRAWLADGRLRNTAAVRYAPRPVATEVRSWVLLPKKKLGTRPDGTLYDEPMKGGDLFYRIPDAEGRVVVTAQVPLQKAWLVVANEELGPLKVHMTAEGSEATSVPFPFRAGDTAYEVYLIDENGFECIDRPRRVIRRLPLAPPEVTLLPETLFREGDTGTPDEREVEGIPIVRTENSKQGRRFNLKYRAEARYGVKRLQLRFRVIQAGKDADAEAGKVEHDAFLTLPLGPANPDEPPTPKALEEFSTLPPAHAGAIPDVEGRGSYDFHIDGVRDLKGEKVELKEGDRIQFYVEAFSKADPKGTPGRSAIREKEIVSLEEFRKWVAAKEDLKERTRLLEEQQRNVKVDE